MSSKPRKVSVQEIVDVGAIASQFSDMFTNTIIDQLQTFVDVCQDMRVDPEQLRAALKVYSQRTGIVGIRVRKTKKSTWSTQEYDVGRTQRNETSISKHAELDEPVSEIAYKGKTLRYYADIQLEDGYSPAFNNYGEVSLALFKQDDEEISLRRLTEVDRTILEDHGIDFVLY